MNGVALAVDAARPIPGNAAAARPGVLAAEIKKGNAIVPTHDFRLVVGGIDDMAALYIGCEEGGPPISSVPLVMGKVVVVGGVTSPRRGASRRAA